MKIHLVIIDPQNDFCHKDGALYVPGATQDMERVAAMVQRLRGKLDDIHVTLDSHRRVDVAHPLWWKDSASDRPAPFTMITADDVSSGKWMTSQPSFFNRSLEYLNALEAGGRYPHVVWPEHCIIGDSGHNVLPVLSEALHEWEEQFAIVDFVTKGSNIWTEHFSAVQAEVPDPEDPSTQVNTRLIETLEDADVVLLAGEARSHCVANTVRDIAACFDDTSVAKMVLLTDAMSDVPDPPGTTMFTDLGDALIADLISMGAQTSTTTDFLR